MKKFRTWLISSITLFCAILFFINKVEKDANNTQTQEKPSILSDLGYRDAGSTRTTSQNFGKRGRVSVAKRSVLPEAKKSTKKGKTESAKAKKGRGESKKIAKKKKKKKKDDKKKKKKEVAKKMEVIIPDTSLAEVDEETSGFQDFEPRSKVVSTVINPTTSNSGIESVDEWLSFLGPNPTQKRINQLIFKTQSKEVPKSTTFEVARELLASRSDKANIGGLRILGAFPSSESYILLSEVIEEDFPEKTRQLAKNFQNDYQQSKNIPFLNQVIANTEIEKSIKIQALATAQKALRVSNQNGGLILTRNENQSFTHPSAQALEQLFHTLEFERSREGNSDLRRRFSDLSQSIESVLSADPHTA